jgi:hypothetical protein
MAFTLSPRAQQAAQLLRQYGPSAFPYTSYVGPYRAAAETLARRFARAQRRMFRPRCGLCGYGFSAMYAVQMGVWAAFPDVYAASARGTDYREAGLAHIRAHGLMHASSSDADNRIWNECVLAMIYKGRDNPDGQDYGDITGYMTWEQRFKLAQDTYAEVERRLASGMTQAFSAQSLSARTCTPAQRGDLWWTAQVTTQGLHLQRQFHSIFGDCATRPTFDRWYGNGLRAYFTDQEQAWEEQIVPWIEVNTSVGDPNGPEDDGGGGFDPADFLGTAWARIVEIVDAQDRNAAPSPVVSTGLRG